MKKIYTSLTCLFLLGSVTTKAQDTLLYEGFQFVMDSYLIHSTASSLPPGNVVDSMWYNLDGDGFADGSGSTTTRPDDWWQILPFSDVDIYQPNGDTNIVMGSNSWFTSPDVADNWLITRNILLGSHDTLFWKSAPRQTPRYLDGYEVRISVTNNDYTHFFTNGGALLFTAAEMTGTVPVDTLFSSFTFSSGFVHGQDGTYIDLPADVTDPAKPSYHGQLRPFSVPLDAYANQNVFIAFHHNSDDDNLISIDDILIRGSLNPFAGINEKQSNDFNIAIFPNPTSDNAQLNFSISSETTATISIHDITGKLVYSENKGEMQAGRHFANINTSVLNKGFYTVTISTNNGKGVSKLIVK